MVCLLEVLGDAFEDDPDELGVNEGFENPRSRLAFFLSRSLLGIGAKDDEDVPADPEAPLSSKNADACNAVAAADLRARCSLALFSLTDQSGRI